MVSPSAGPSYPTHPDAHDAVRFLKARQWDPSAAYQMWTAMLTWRRENRVDTIHDWFVFHEKRDFDRVFPTGLHKTDRNVSLLRRGLARSGLSGVMIPQKG